MLKGIDINERIDYVSKHDDSEPKTVFVFRYLTSSEMLGLSKYFSDSGSKISGDDVINILDQAIVEIRNFQTNDKRQALSSLPLNVLEELVANMLSINKLGEIERKNS